MELGNDMTRLTFLLIASAIFFVEGYLFSGLIADAVILAAIGTLYAYLMIRMGVFDFKRQQKRIFQRLG